MHQQRLRKEVGGLHAPEGGQRRKKHAAPREDVAVPLVTNEEEMLYTHSFGNLATQPFLVKGRGPWFCLPASSANRPDYLECTRGRRAPPDHSGFAVIENVKQPKSLRWFKHT